MTILGKDKIRHIARVLQYAPIAIAFFFAVSFWRKGFTEGAIAFGLMGIGFLLLGRVDICGIICICPHLPYPIVNGQK